MNDLRDFLNWFDGFAENIDKTPSSKQWTKIKDRVTALRGVAPESVTTASAPKPAPVEKSKPKYPFFIDTDGKAKNKQGKRILPGDVTDILYDLRGIDGDIGTITWADDSQGLNGADLTISGA